jgi:hypothetical protein
LTTARPFLPLEFTHQAVGLALRKYPLATDAQTAELARQQAPQHARAVQA